MHSTYREKNKKSQEEDEQHSPRRTVSCVRRECNPILAPGKRPKNRWPHSPFIRRKRRLLAYSPLCHSTDLLPSFFFFYSEAKNTSRECGREKKTEERKRKEERPTTTLSSSPRRALLESIRPLLLGGRTHQRNTRTQTSRSVSLSLESRLKTKQDT